MKNRAAPLPVDDQARLRAVLERLGAHGLEQFIERAGGVLGRASILRAAAGQSVLRATASVILHTVQDIESAP